MREFNRFNLDVKSMDGGSLVTAQLTMASNDGVEVVDQREEIVAGQPGTPALNARIRRAIKRLTEKAFPKPPKVAGNADAPGQTVHPQLVH